VYLNATVTSQGYNLVGDDEEEIFTETGDMVGQDPSAGGLLDNGGPTFTHALLEGSPAIDAGTDQGAPVVDQRGEARAPGRRRGRHGRA
jgi:hypothetical protein